METVVFNVEGIKCGGCESSITGKLKQVSGVSRVQASHTSNTVEVQFNPEETTAECLQQVIVADGLKIIA